MAMEIIRHGGAGVKVLPYSGFDYMDGEKLVQGAHPSLVMVRDEGELSKLTGYIPGSVAFTVAGGNAWQLGLDGTWTAFE